MQAKTARDTGTAPVGEAAPDAAAVMGEGASHVVSGVLFLAIGGAALLLGSGYQMGTTLNMGPGYFPRLVAIGLMALGLATAVKGMRSGGWQVPGFAWRPGIAILGAILVFGLGVDRLGLFGICVVTALIGAAAQPVTSWLRILVIAFCVATFCAVVFGHLLTLSIPVWPR